MESNDELPRHTRKPASARERLAAVATTLAGAGLVAGGLAASIGDADDDAKTVVGAIDAPTTSAALAPDAAPEAVFAAAQARVEDVGTFTYEGTSRVEGTDPFDDRRFLDESTFAGEVRVARGVHEVADEADGSRSERVELATSEWTRATAFPDQLDARPWVPYSETPWALDPHRLGEWLGEATRHRDGGEDSQGHRIAIARVAFDVLSSDPDLPPTAGEITITVDDTGLPTEVQVDVHADGLAVTSTYVLGNAGESVIIRPPAADALDQTPLFDEEDLAATGGPLPVGLGGVPVGWELVDAYVVPDPSGDCVGVGLDYTDLDDPVGSYLWISVMAPDCAIDPPGAEPFSAGTYEGAATFDAGLAEGVVRDDTVAVAFSSDLSPDDLRQVLGTLGPLDLTATPAQLEGIPSSPA